MNNTHVVIFSQSKDGNIIIQVSHDGEFICKSINPNDYDYKIDNVSIGFTLESGEEFTVIKDLELFIESVNLRLD